MNRSPDVPPDDATNRPRVGESTRPALPSAAMRSLNGLLAALRILFPIAGRDRAKDLTANDSAPGWFVPLGLLVGLVWAGAFKAIWRYRDDMIVIRVMPALAVIFLECLITGSYLVLGLARTVSSLASAPKHRLNSDRDAPLSPFGTLTLCLTVVSMWVLVSSMPTISDWWPPLDDWRYHLRRLYPAYVYRPLVLAPIWGRWAIILAATVGRTAASADRSTHVLCRAMRPSRFLLHSVFPFAITSIYLSRSGNYMTGLMVGLLVFGFAYVASVVAARRGGGQTHESLCAVGEIGQLTFLVLYRAFWPLIRG